MCVGRSATTDNARACVFVSVRARVVSKLRTLFAPVSAALSCRQSGSRARRTVLGNERGTGKGYSRAVRTAAKPGFGSLLFVEISAPQRPMTRAIANKLEQVHTSRTHARAYRQQLTVANDGDSRPRFRRFRPLRNYRANRFESFSSLSSSPPPPPASPEFVALSPASTSSSVCRNSVCSTRQQSVAYFRGGR